MIVVDLDRFLLLELFLFFTCVGVNVIRFAFISCGLCIVFGVLGLFENLGVLLFVLGAMVFSHTV